MEMPTREQKRSRFGVGLFLGFAIMAVMFFGITRAPQIVAQVPNLAAVISSVLVELTNTDRATSGLATLAVSDTLTAVAQAKANDMAQKGYFAHTSPEGLSPWHWFKQEGYTFSYAGENLAVDFTESADIERAWMNSPTHRANIVGTQFTEIGIALATGTYQGRPTTFVVQVFGTPVPAALASGAAAPRKTAPAATTTVAAVTVRDIVAEPAAGTTALATTLPTTTVTVATESTVLGDSAGAYLQTSVQVPWWFRWYKKLGF